MWLFTRGYQLVIWISQRPIHSSTIIDVSIYGTWTYRTGLQGIFMIATLPLHQAILPKREAAIVGICWIETTSMGIPTTQLWNHIQKTSRKVSIVSMAIVLQAVNTIGKSLAGWWFQPTPLKNISSSVGMMKFTIYGKIKKCSEPPTS